MPSDDRDTGHRLLGIDIGSVNVKVAFCDRDGQPTWTSCRPSRGKPLETLDRILKELVREKGASTPVCTGITGGGNTLVRDHPGLVRVNEIVAAARAAQDAVPGGRTVIDLGGQFSKWILLGEEDSTVSDFATNGLCAAGTGAFMEQQAGRLRLSLDQLGEAAGRAERGASIAGRCSVFAKSDMIHLQQKGTPVDEVALGLCQSLVRTFAGTVLNGREVEPPVVLAGGGAVNPGLLRAFHEVLRLPEDAIHVPDDPLMLSALGAARLSGDSEPMALWDLLELVRPDGAETICCGVETERAHLPPLPAVDGTERASGSEEPPVPEGDLQAWLGIDVGSVSTNLVLLDPDLEVLQGIYLPTRGRPVDALNEGFARIRRRFGDRVRILGVGATGSGRHLAARITGADVVHNEITAQMVSSTRYVPEVDTIFEIGGQDSKYIHVRNGKLADFDMNKICAAGTGSFLEEQAERLGISIVEEFADLACRASRPCDLGTRCTVFMDSELARAQERGAPVEDICAGLAYSVSRNYLEKLVAGRRIGDCVVFQGGTASNGAVVGAFRRLLGRAVHVHPYNRVSGAIGAAVLAARAMETGEYETAFLGFDACAHAESGSFECKRCENLCQVNRVRVGERTVHFGDTCERYSERDRDAAVSGRPFPELFAEREALFESLVGGGDGDPDGGEPIGVVRGSLNLEFLPFWSTFLRALGFRPVISPRCTTRALEVRAGAVPAEVCLPIKAAAAQAHALLDSGKVERLFLPSVLECPPREDDTESHACLYNQGLPDMLRSALGDRLISAQFALQDGVLGMIEPVLALSGSLDRSEYEVARAFRTAREAQAEFDAARQRLGSIAFDAGFDRAVVVMGKPYNTHDPFLNLGLAKLLDRVGLPAIPWDLLPLDRVRLEERWKAVPWHFNREQLRTLEFIRRDGRLFPILVSSYGCGLDAFVVKHLEEMLADMPRLLLEFDEHRGEAGLITRLEAFADEIDAHLSHGAVKKAPRITPGSAPVPRGKRFFIPDIADHARIYRGVLRGAGYDAEVLPGVDEETVRLGEEVASGRECHPYSIIAGEFRRLLRRKDLGRDDVFLSPSCRTPCLLRQYGDGFRLIAERSGVSLEVWDAATADLKRIVGMQGVTRMFEGLLAVDILITLESRLRPYVRDPRRLDHLKEEALELLAEGTAENRKLDTVLSTAARYLLELPRNGNPGDRPVVGVTGDLYTRIHPAGNAGLFRRLEAMGCEVWPSPSFASMNELGAAMGARSEIQRVRVPNALTSGLAWAVTTSVRQRISRALPEQARELAVEPPPDRFLELASGHVGERTNYMVVHGVGKIADFLSRGASGAISAVGINCMVGTAIDAAIPSLRAAYGHAPVTTLAYGGIEGPAQRLRLETFVHQVGERRRRVG